MLEGIGSNFEDHLNLFKETISSRVKCLEEIGCVKCIRKTDVGLESGTCEKGHGIQTCPGLQLDDSEEMKIMADPMLQHLDDLDSENMDIMKDGVVLMSMSAVAFCMDGLLRESIEMKKDIREIVQWENPSTQLDFNYILCKLHALNRIVTV